MLNINRYSSVRQHQHVNFLDQSLGSCRHESQFWPARATHGVWSLGFGWLPPSLSNWLEGIVVPKQTCIPPRAEALLKTMHCVCGDQGDGAVCLKVVVFQSKQPEYGDQPSCISAVPWKANRLLEDRGCVKVCYIGSEQ